MVTPAIPLERGEHHPNPPVKGRTHGFAPTGHLVVYLVENVGAGPCACPSDWQPRGVAPTLFLLDHPSAESFHGIFSWKDPSLGDYRGLDDDY